MSHVLRALIFPSQWHKPQADIGRPDTRLMRSERIRQLVHSVWAGLPQSVRDDLVRRRVIFHDEFHATSILGSCGAGDIWLNSLLLANNDAMLVRRIIAHEIAHFACNHYPVDTPVEKASAELQAYHLCSQWGF